MASSSAQILYLLSATALLLLSATPIHANARVLSADTCQKTTYPDLCQSLLATGNFHSQKDFTAHAIKQAIGEIKSGIESAEKLKAAADNDELRKLSLDACKSAYKDAIGDLENGLDMVKGSTATNLEVKNYLSAAHTNVGTCRDDWSSTGITDFPLQQVDDRLKNLVTNIFDLGKDLGSN